MAAPEQARPGLSHPRPAQQPNRAMTDPILVINCGSSSLKMALYRVDGACLANALAEKLGRDGAGFRLSGDDRDTELPLGAGHDHALTALIAAFQDRGLLGQAPRAIGHRVVHGGEAFRNAALIDESVIGAIRDCARLAPLHNPVNLTGITAARDRFPGVPQVAVFDTAFHQSLPRHAYLYALPRRFYEDWGVRRYGFHGTSHSYMLEESARRLEQPPAATSIISAHLGNGCSITAIRDGQSVDTSMGLTPLEGLVMGTRSGDVDPGLFDFLRGKGLDATEVDRILNNDSGLLGLSGQTNDMRSIVGRADAGDPDADDALRVFCFRLARYIGAMMASLEHLDALVFTGGIGENSARVRELTLSHLGLAGFVVDGPRNQHHGRDTEGRIDASESRFPVLVIATNEEWVIAREALRHSGVHADPISSPGDTH